MRESEPLEVVRSNSGLALGIAMWLGLIGASIWVVSEVGLIGLWVALAWLVLGGIVWATSGRPRLEVYREEFLLVMPFGTRRVRWDETKGFRIDAHPAWGLIGYVDLNEGPSLPLWFAVARKWYLQAGFDAAWRRIDHLNDLLRRFGS